MEQFIPPSFNLPLAWMVDFSLPVLLKQVENLQSVEIQPADLELLRSLRKERLLYVSNHPTNSEPAVAYYVAHRMGTRFNFMASRQVFDWGYGAIGKIIQGLGAFSVLPGVADRESVRTARRVLAAPEGKLVLYPEGEPTSGENDSLMPFQPGVSQLAFWALAEARESDPQADIKVLPTFVKYVVTGNDVKIKVDLHTSIRRLERRFQIEPGNKNLLRRFLTVGRVLLEQAEGEYQVVVGDREDFEYRIGRLRHAILDGIADRFKINNYQRDADAIQKLRQFLSIIEMIEIDYKGIELPRLSGSELQWMKRECGKAYDFIIIRPEYLVSRPTAERFFEWLNRYDNYVFGKTNTRTRRAHVFFGPPISLAAWASRYRENKRRTVEDLTTTLRKEVQKLLDATHDLTHPIVRPYDVEGS
ncbi:MAG: 1-acyl-sn-glycerol-3-phosphate acyltransferase [Spirochaetales bacterium]|nr:1-acyl-sn-glycerol-3-phosphate acyltransferase [Leptospiraceae bacterium]MCP5479874.1 1-acyl-sn-glycerol-3-phosphate acyltransferase [Spirochaetales bacterium]MCP5486264.1 1-acyl-sn-glycerol-3-phosphate acyltransferase [Spirochaetales bacterium]